jgi:hypothetical protein
MRVIKPIPAAPVAPDNPTRSTLRSAIVECNVAKERMQRAKQTVQRARELLKGSEEKLTAFGDVDALILKHRADKIKRAATGGPAPDMSLPDDLVARRTMRDEAREHVAAAKAAHESLVADLGQAESAVRKANLRVSECAIEILVAEGAIQAAALKSAWKNLWDTFDELSALAGCWWPGNESPRPTRLPADAIQVLQATAQYDHRQHPGGSNAALKQAGERWRAWHERLCSDADAKFVDDDASSGTVERVA